MSYGPEYDDYAESGNEDRVSDDYTPRYTDTDETVYPMPNWTEEDIDAYLARYGTAASEVPFEDIEALLHTNPWDKG